MLWNQLSGEVKKKKRKKTTEGGAKNVQHMFI